MECRNSRHLRICQPMLLTSLSCSALCLAPPEYLRRKLCCGLAECSRSLREPSYRDIVGQYSLRVERSYLVVFRNSENSTLCHCHHVRLLYERMLKFCIGFIFKFGCLYAELRILASIAESDLTMLCKFLSSRHLKGPKSVHKSSFCILGS